jgi:hypothetical protein
MLFFTPVAALILAIQEWSEWKKPFLVYFGAQALQFVFMVAWIASVDPMEKMLAAMEESDFGKVQAMRMIDELESKRSLTPEEQEQLEYLKQFLANYDDEPQAGSGAGSTTSGSDSMRVSSQSYQSYAPPPTRPRRSLAKIRPRVKEITIDSASPHIGQEVRLEATDGRIYSGTLTKAQPGRIWVEFHVGGGTVELEFRRQEVRELTVRL